MYKYLFLILLSFNIFTNAFANTYEVKANVDTIGDYNLQLRLGESYQTIATQTITNNTAKNNVVIFNLTDKDPKGFYRIANNSTIYTDIIFNHHDIEFSTTAKKPLINTKIIKDNQNKDYYSALMSRDATNKRKLLISLLNYYPRDSYFYQILKNKNNYEFANDFKKTTARIIAENKPYNKLLIRKLKDNEAFKELKKQFKDKDIAVKELFTDFVIDDFAIYSNMTSNRLNFYLLKVYLKHKDDKEKQKVSVYQAKDELLEFFKDNKYHQQITQIIEDILSKADL